MNKYFEDLQAVLFCQKLMLSDSAESLFRELCGAIDRQYLGSTSTDELWGYFIRRLFFFRHTRIDSVFELMTAVLYHQTLIKPLLPETWVASLDRDLGADWVAGWFSGCVRFTRRCGLDNKDITEAEVKRYAQEACLDTLIPIVYPILIEGQLGQMPFYKDRTTDAMWSLRAWINQADKEDLLYLVNRESHRTHEWGILMYFMGFTRETNPTDGLFKFVSAFESAGMDWRTNLKAISEAIYK